MTDWANEPSIDDLLYDLEQAKPSQQAQVAKVAQWKANFNPKKLERKKGSRSSTIQPKLIRKQAEWRCSALSEVFLSTDTLFKLDPMTHEDKKRALQNELILNYQFMSKINRVKFIDDFIRTAVEEGTSIIRAGWVYNTTTEILDVPEWQYIQAPEELLEQLQQAVQLYQTEPDTFEAALPDELKESVKATLHNGFPVLAQQVGITQLEQVKVTTNSPTLEIVNINNFYADPTCEGDFSKAQFAIHSFESSLSELKQEGRYKNLDKLNINENGQYTSPDHSYSASGFSFKDEARKKITVYEYWGYYDIDGKGITKPIIATWVGRVLIRLEENPFPDKRIPFIVVPYIPQTRSIYGIPDGELLEDNQNILGAVTRGIIDLLGKSANSQTGIAKGVLDATNMIRFRNGEDYEYNPNSNPQSQVYMHKYPEIPNSALTLISMMNNDAEAISGVKAFSGQGITGAGLGDTAAGVRSAMDAASKREMSILRRLASGIMQVGRKIIAMNSEFLSEEEVIRLTNSEFITVRRDDLAGEYDVRLNISTAEADEAKAAELANMLNSIGNSMDVDMRNLILADIARLRKMPELAHKIETYEPQPDPMQQQMQELELARLQAEIAMLNAQAQEAAAKAQVHGAKVGVEEARAESLQGDADLKAQNFVDNQSGLNHQKDLDKKSLEGNNVLEQQRLKNVGDFNKLLAQYGLNRDIQKQKHNSELLKLIAQQDIGTRQPLSI